MSEVPFISNVPAARREVEELARKFGVRMTPARRYHQLRVQLGCLRGIAERWAKFQQEQPNARMLDFRLALYFEAQDKLTPADSCHEFPMLI